MRYLVYTWRVPGSQLYTACSYKSQERHARRYCCCGTSLYWLYLEENTASATCSLHSTTAPVRVSEARRASCVRQRRSMIRPTEQAVLLKPSACECLISSPRHCLAAAIHPYDWGRDTSTLQPAIRKDEAYHYYCCCTIDPTPRLSSTRYQVSAISHHNYSCTVHACLRHPACIECCTCYTINQYFPLQLCKQVD